MSYQGRIQNNTYGRGVTGGATGNRGGGGPGACPSGNVKKQGILGICRRLQTSKKKLDTALHMIYLKPPLTLQVFHYYLTFSFHLKLALLTQLPTSNERKIPPHLKIKPAKFHNGGFTQDLYMHICSISGKF